MWTGHDTLHWGFFGSCGPPGQLALCSPPALSLILQYQYIHNCSFDLQIILALSKKNSPTFVSLRRGPLRLCVRGPLTRHPIQTLDAQTCPTIPQHLLLKTRSYNIDAACMCSRPRKQRAMNRPCSLAGLHGYGL